MPQARVPPQIPQARAHIFISGEVQGVFFRAFAQDVARRLGLVGYVRNMPDGRVEVIVEGTQHTIEQMVSYLKKGPPGAVVTAVDIVWQKPTGEFKDFVIRYW